MLYRGGSDTPSALIFGADYNPEQWPRDTWGADLDLMRESSLGLATVGVFAWALLEPEPGHYDFDWLADVIDGLHAAGIAVDLATATASPPAWLGQLDPMSLPIDHEGRTRWPGARQAYCPSSASWRARSLALVEALAARFGEHSAIALWHVGNEYGCHTSRCYCDRCAIAFRLWLREKYGDVGSLNDAWGTTFWSQHYPSFDYVLPPRLTPDGAWANPTQQLDYRRFASDLLLESFVAERNVLHRFSPGVPVTTNFMVMTRFNQLDYWRWAQEVDVVSSDFYPDFADPQSHIEAALSADTVRGLAGGKPWMLMETSPSAVNWQPRNLAKPAGQLQRDALQQFAHGADAFCVFQFRAAKAGAEKFHSGLVPHAGTDTRLWREVVELGEMVTRLHEVAGTAVTSQVAIVWDYDCWWACELDSHPSIDVRYPDRALALYGALFDGGISVDVIHPDADMSSYKLVIVPTLYLVDDSSATKLADYVRNGGHTLITYFSGIVDSNDHIRLGGYPGAYRDLLGVLTEEFCPLPEGMTVSLAGAVAGTCDTWTEDLRLVSAEAISTYVDGPVAGAPALTRNRLGEGVAWYAATRTTPAATASLMSLVVAGAAVTPVAEATSGVELVRRQGQTGSFLFAINHTAAPAHIRCRGMDLVTGERITSSLTLISGAIAVVLEDA